MPPVANQFSIISNYGKSNILHLVAKCNKCHITTPLLSYTTTRFITLGHLPLFPIGKIRVTNECPLCLKMTKTSFKKWKKQKDKEFSKIADELREDISNPDAIARALATSLNYQDENLFYKFKQLVKGSLLQNAEISQHIAHGYEQFGEYDLAENEYKKTLNSENSPEVRSRLGLLLIRKDKPEEAEVYLEHLWKDNIDGYPEEFQILTDSYLQNGDYDRAVHLFENLLNDFPSLEKTKDFKKSFKKAKSLQKSQKNFKSPLSKKITEVEKINEGRFNLLPYIALPAVLIILLGLHTYYAVSMGMGREIHLINGIDQPYQAIINGTEFPLEKNSHQIVKIPEGDIHVSVKNKELDIPDLNITIKTPYWKRPFIKRNHVINPDQAAFLIKEKFYYAEEGITIPRIKPEDLQFFTGKNYHIAESVNYAFTEVPEEISVSDSLTSRTQLYQNNDPYMIFFQYSIKSENRFPKALEALKTYSNQRLKYDPENVYLMRSISRLLKKEDALEIVTRERNNHMESLNWNLTYLNLRKRKFPAYHLKDEYLNLQKKKPEDFTIQYCLSKIAETPSEKIEILKSLRDKGSKIPLITEDLGDIYYYTGEFEKALKYYNELINLAEKETNEYHYNYLMTLLALKKYEKIINISTQKTEKLTIYDAGNFLNYSYYTVHGKIKATEFFKKLLSQTEVDPEYVDELEESPEDFWKVIKNQWNYYDNNLAVYANNLKKSSFENEDTFKTFFLKSEIDSAIKYMKNNEKSYRGKERPVYLDLYTPRLILYLYFSQHNQPEKAKTHLEAAIKHMSLSRERLKEYAEMLSDAGSKPNPTQLPNIEIHASSKRLLLAVAGTRFPVKREQYFALAQKFNIEPFFPFQFLNQYLANPTQQKTPVTTEKN